MTQSWGGPSLRDTHTHPSGQEAPGPRMYLHRWTEGVAPKPPDSLTRQYSSMGFSLLTATSRMWLLRKRILPGREMLVSQVIPGKAATGTWDPPLSVPSPLASRHQGNKGVVTSFRGQEAPKAESPGPLGQARSPGGCHLAQVTVSGSNGRINAQTWAQLPSDLANKYKGWPHPMLCFVFWPIPP